MSNVEGSWPCIQAIKELGSEPPVKFSEKRFALCGPACRHSGKR